MKRGNVRLMHRHDIVVGKATQAEETPENEWAMAIKIPDTQWGNDALKMIDEGMLTGVSIGVKNPVVADIGNPNHPKGLIKGGSLVEVSFVDYPAYQYSTLSHDPADVGLTLMKRHGNGTYEFAGSKLRQDTDFIRPGITDPWSLLTKEADLTTDSDLTGHNLLGQKKNEEDSIAEDNASPEDENDEQSMADSEAKEDADAEDSSADDEDDSEDEKVAKAAFASASWYAMLSRGLLSKRDFDSGVGGGVDRDKLPEEDFAGPHRSYPIVNQQDVHDAASLIGHAENPEAVKSKIKSIARRKGFSLPKEWEDEDASKAAAAEKAGRRVSAATASHLRELASADGVPESVRSSLNDLADLADFPVKPAAEDKSDGNDGAPKQLREGGHIDDTNPEKLDPLRPASISNPNLSDAMGGGYGVDMDCDDGAHPYKGVTPDEVKSITAETIEKFITSDTFLSKIVEAASAKVAAEQASEDAKVATEAAQAVDEKAETLKSELSELRKSFGDEIERIKALPQPPKGMVMEMGGVTAIEKSFAMNPQQPVGDQTQQDVIGALISKAAGGDDEARRLLYDVSQKAGSTAGRDLSLRTYEAVVRNPQ